MKTPSGMDPTAYGDDVAHQMREYYEQNRESWWFRKSQLGQLTINGGVADNLMLGLLNIVKKNYRD